MRLGLASIESVNPGRRRMDELVVLLVRTYTTVCPICPHHELFLQQPRASTSLRQ